MKLNKVVFRQPMRIGRGDKKHLITVDYDPDSRAVRMRNPELQLEFDKELRCVIASGLNPHQAHANLDDTICIPMENIAYFCRTAQSLRADAARQAQKEKRQG